MNDNNSWIQKYFIVLHYLITLNTEITALTASPPLSNFFGLALLTACFLLLHVKIPLPMGFFDFLLILILVKAIDYRGTNYNQNVKFDL